MKFIGESLPIKISLIILCVGSTAMILMGSHYVKRFKHEIDERIIGKLNIPGYLMSQRVLNIDVVEDDLKALENLIGEEIVQAFVLKKDGTISFAPEAEREGRNFRRYLHQKEQLDLTKGALEKNHISHYTTLNGGSFLSILAPLRLQFEKNVDGYLYIKINAEKIQAKKDEIANLFFLGSTLVIALTTILEALFVHVLVVPRISRTVSVLEQVEKGDFAAKIEPAHSPDELGHLQRSVNSMIAEIESASDALRRSEERYRLLFEEAPISLWEEDFSGIQRYFDQLRASGVSNLPAYLRVHPEAVQHCAKLVKVLDVNNATLELFDANEKQDILADPSKVFTEGSRERFQEELVMLAKGKDRFTNEFVQRSLSGAERHVILHLEVAPGYKNSLGKILISLIDITKRKRAEEELKRYQDHLEDLVQLGTAELRTVNRHLQQEIAERTRVEQELRTAKDAAESANQAKSIFLANMSHELRTPLNAILGFAQLMVRNQSLTTIQRENLNIILRSGEHLLTLINDILDMSKIEAGRIALMPHSFDLHQMLRSLEEMMSLRAARKDLLLTVTCAPDIPRNIIADEAKLRQVLLNLLSNAVKFTEEGEVQLSVSRKQAAEGRRREAESDFQHLRFTVKDTGLGIASEEMCSLFDAFVQTQSGHKLREGTGLGLAISRKFVELMGGEIAVSSQEGVGTSFTFDIQVESAEGTAIDTQQTTSPKQVNGLAPNQMEYRILVVDDQNENRKFLKSLLQIVGFRVQEASCGEEAINTFVHWRPHLIFLDIRMPGIDGNEAARRIRELEARDEKSSTSSISIIAVSASAFEEDQTRAREAGCDDFVHKPFREELIFQILEQQLGVRYLYKEPEKTEMQSTGQVLGNALFPEALNALPAELLEELNLAVEQLNIEQITVTIDEARRHNAAVAEALSAFAERFRYRELRSILQGHFQRRERGL